MFTPHPVIDLLQHGTAESQRGQRENPQCAEAQVTNRGIGHQLLHVFLHQRNQRAIQDADNR